MNELDEKDRQFIQEKKNIQWSYARNSMPPCPNPAVETEEQFRKRVREGLEYLSDEERANMRQDIRRAYYDIFSPSINAPPLTPVSHD